MGISDIALKLSTERILTSHAGGLPRPDDLIEANRARAAGEAADEPAFQRKLRDAVADGVRRQKLEALAQGATLATRQLWG